MAAVTNNAPLEPNTVYWLSTSMPIAVVIAQPSAHSALSVGTHAEREAADPRAQHDCLRDADRKTADRALDDEVAHAGPVADRGGADPEPDRESDAGRRDPLACRRTVRSQAPRLDGAEDHAGDGAADERRHEPVDRAGHDARRRSRRAGSRGRWGASAARFASRSRAWSWCVHGRAWCAPVDRFEREREAGDGRHDVTATPSRRIDEVAVRRVVDQDHDAEGDEPHAPQDVTEEVRGVDHRARRAARTRRRTRAPPTSRPAPGTSGRRSDDRVRRRRARSTSR